MKLSLGDRLLVTGGTGVIGAWVVRDLLEAGFKPIVLTRGLTTVGNPLWEDRKDEIEFVKCDLEQHWALVNAVRRLKPDGIVHMASSKPWQIDAPHVSDPDPVAGINNMIIGTTNILEVARHFGIKRVVYGSSKGAYSATAGEYGYPTYKPLPESYPCLPDTMYGIGKRSAEMIGQYYNDVMGVDFIAVRFAGSFGPFKRGSGNQPASLIVRAAKGEPINVTLDEFAYRNERNDHVYNRDIARGIRLACLAEEPVRRIYNLGSGTAHSLEEFFAAVREAIPSAEISISFKQGEDFRGSRRRGNRDGLLDITSAREDLGYQPQYDLVSGIRETASFY